MILLAAFLLTAQAAPPDTSGAYAAIYPAPHTPVSTAGLPGGVAIVSVRTVDGLDLKGLEIAPRPGKPTLLVLHGNESSAMESIRWFAPLIAQGYGVVAAEYRGYADNPGIASEPGLGFDAEAFAARARAVAAGGKLILVGHSLGAGVAFALAGRQRFDALVTIGAFTRLAALIADDSRSNSVTDRYDNIGAIPALSEPLYLIHGTADDTVPFAQESELAAAAVAAHKTGAGFVIDGEGHAPDGGTLTMILTAIVAKLENGGKTVSVTLPQTVKVLPFQP